MHVRIEVTWLCACMFDLFVSVRECQGPARVTAMIATDYIVYVSYLSCFVGYLVVVEGRERAYPMESEEGERREIGTE